MAEFDFNNNDVFGGVKFEGGENDVGTPNNECSSFFETPFITASTTNTPDSVNTENTSNSNFELILSNSSFL